MEYLPRNDYLRCRLICKIWQQDLDHVYQNHPENSEEDGITFPRAKTRRMSGEFPILNRPFQALAYGTSFQNEGGKIHAFLADMEHHPGNPFPGRSIAIAFTNADLEYYTQIEQLLNTFGHEIWHLLIRLNGYNSPDLESLSKILENCLIRVPNVKRLELMGNYDNERQRWPECVPNNLEQNPLPILYSLETLIVNVGCWCVPDFLVDNVVNSCCNPATIKNVYLHDADNDFRYNSRYYPSDKLYLFQNLEVLHATVFFRMVEKLQSLSPVLKLKKISLLVERDEVKLSFEKVFITLQTFFDTITEITLIFKGGLVPLPISFRINLPKLRKLYLDQYIGPPAVLLRLGSVKDLQLHVERVQPYDESVVERIGFDLKKIKSDIWGFLPNLQRFKVNMLDERGFSIWDTFHRSELE